jgi:hypothetical protein
MARVKVLSCVAVAGAATGVLLTVRHTDGPLADLTGPAATNALVGALAAAAIAAALLVTWRTRRGSAAAASGPRPAGRREPIAERVRHEVWRRDGGRCVDCGSGFRLEFDHIIPVSRGGSNTARNIELRCEPCNRRKGARV